MILITPEERVSKTADLLRSLEQSVRELRQVAESLRADIEAGEHADVTARTRELEQAGRLIRSCQKVEECFVEQQQRQTGIAQGGYALDLDAARLEIGCRLARLRACCDP